MRQLIMLALMLMLSHAQAAINDSAANIDWGYKGNNGPVRWGQLDPGFLLCAKGKMQSPINLPQQIRANSKPHQLQFHYQASPMHIVVNGVSNLTIGNMPLQIRDGQGIQLNFPVKGPAQTLVLDGKSYRLVQLHFHSPSENMLYGENYQMEVHFVHQGAAGQVLVLAVFIDAGKLNAELQKLVTQFPKDAGIVHDLSQTFNPAGLLPDKLDYYHFGGSLTVPPCTEGVEWIVMAKPIEAASAQILLFRKVVGGNNARNVQNRNQREISFSKVGS